MGPMAHVWRLDRGTLTDPGTRVAWGGMARAAHIVAADAVTPLVVQPTIIAAEGLWLDRYWRVGGEWSVYVPLGEEMVLRQRAAGGWGEGLPASRLLVVGGAHGFPGLHRDAWRATRAASASIGILRRVAGPLSAYADLGAGWASAELAESPLLLGEAARGTLAGAEVGFTAPTPIGTATLGYGLTTRGGSVLRIQLGR
jgi:hypothetical protein